MGLESRKRSSEDESGSGERKGKYQRGNEPLLKALVHNIIAGKIIGKGGLNLPELKTKYGGHVRVSGTEEYYPGTEERVVIITGSIPEIIENYKHILEISHDTGREPLKDGRGERNMIVVTNSCAGKLIGTKGAAVRAIQDEFEVKVSIADNVAGSLALSSERVLTMSGRLDKRIEACSQIIETIAEEEDNMANTNTKYTSNILSRSGRSHENQRGSRSFDNRLSRFEDLLAMDQRNLSDQYITSGNQRERKRILPQVFKSKIEAELEIPDKVVGHLMGKGGQTIKSFVQQSRGANFIFSEKDEFVKDTTNRTLTIRGTLEQVKIAFELVQAKGEDMERDGLM